MDEDPAGQENDPPFGDLDAGLRDRLRRASGEGGDLTHAELLELAGALNRQRQQIAAALADLGRREAEAARVRDALETTSHDAELALDERDARLSALSTELEAERQRLAARAQELSAAEQELARRTAEVAERMSPQPVPPPAEPGRSFEAVISELRARIERVEAALDLRERLERVEAALAVRMQTVRDHAPAQFEERLPRLEALVDSLACLLRQSLEAVPLRTARAREPSDAPRDEPPPEDPPLEELSGAVPPPEPPPADQAAVVQAVGHVLFVATVSGYHLLERDGPAPALGERLTLEEFADAEATVTAPRSSPLPGDLRPCLVCVIEDVSVASAARDLDSESSVSSGPGSVAEPGS